MNDAEVRRMMSDIQERLDRSVEKHHYSFRLRVVPEKYRQEDEWIYIPVSPASEGIKAHQYVRILSDVEFDLRDEGKDTLLLVPSAAD